MKLRPHGARVVPTVAVTNTIVERSRGIEGITSPRAVAAQSGWARIPAAM